MSVHAKARKAEIGKRKITTTTTKTKANEGAKPFNSTKPPKNNYSVARRADVCSPTSTLMRHHVWRR
jgi:hypothetical protein